MTAEEADAAVDAYMAELGVTLESLIETEKVDYWQDKLFDATVASVTATDEEIQGALRRAARLADRALRPVRRRIRIRRQQRRRRRLQSGGYRRVKQILLAFDDPNAAAQAQELTEQIAALSVETDFEQITQLQEQLDALYADLDAEADAILEQLNSGADFESLMAQYNEDDGANYEPVRTQGYYVLCEHDAVFARLRRGQHDARAARTGFHAGAHGRRRAHHPVRGRRPRGRGGARGVRDAVAEDVLADKRQTYYEEQGRPVDRRREPAVLSRADAVIRAKTSPRGSDSLGGFVASAGRAGALRSPRP